MDLGHVGEVSQKAGAGADFGYGHGEGGVRGLGDGDAEAFELGPDVVGALGFEIAAVEEGEIVGGDGDGDWRRGWAWSVCHFGGVIQE